MTYSILFLVQITWEWVLNKLPPALHFLQIYKMAHKDKVKTWLFLPISIWHIQTLLNPLQIRSYLSWLQIAVKLSPKSAKNLLPIRNTTHINRINIFVQCQNWSFNNSFSLFVVILLSKFLHNAYTYISLLLHRYVIFYPGAKICFTFRQSGNQWRWEHLQHKAKLSLQRLAQPNRDRGRKW